MLAIEVGFKMSYIGKDEGKYMFNLVKLVLGVMFGVLGFYYLTGYFLMFFQNMGFSSFLTGSAIGLGLIVLAYITFYFINLKKVEPEFDMETQTKFTIVGGGECGDEPEIIPDHDFGHEPKMKDITPTNKGTSKTIH
jgi:hypothetical protein